MFIIVIQTSNYVQFIQEHEETEYDEIDGFTREYMVFRNENNFIRLGFTYSFMCDRRTRVLFYTEFYDFSGHKKIPSYEREWIENYCRTHFGKT